MVLYCLCVLWHNVAQGAKSNTVGTRYYSTLGATSTLIICDSRGLSAGDDAYEDWDDQDGVLVMNIMSQESNLKQMCWYGWQNPTGFQWYQKLPSNPLSVCLKNPCVHVLFYFLLITDKKRLLNHSTLEKWKANRANEGLNPSKPILMQTEHCLSSICSPT